MGVFMMSHNASATPISFPVAFTGVFNTTYVRCRVDGQAFVQVNGKTCVWGPNVGGNLQGRGFNYIESSPIPVQTGHIYEMLITVGTSTNAELMIPATWSVATTGNFQVVYFEQVSNNNNIGSSATYEGYVSQYIVGLRSLINNNSWPVQFGFSDGIGNLFYLMGDNWPVVVDTRIESISRYQILDSSAGDTAIVNAINQLKQSQEAQNAKEEQAVENIEDQSPSDMQVGSDSSAQSLIGTLTSFLSYITNLQATNCNVSLPFPSYAGGTQTFNVCQGKDKAGNIVSIFSSLTLFVFYLPVAFKLLGIIYSEIRSFTNG